MSERGDGRPKIKKPGRIMGILVGGGAITLGGAALLDKTRIPTIDSGAGEYRGSMKRPLFNRDDDDFDGGSATGDAPYGNLRHPVGVDKQMKMEAVDHEILVVAEWALGLAVAAALIWAATRSRGEAAYA